MMATIEDILLARAKAAEEEAAKLRERLRLIERLIEQLAAAAADKDRVA